MESHFWVLSVAPREDDEILQTLRGGTPQRKKGWVPAGQSVQM